MRTVLRTRVALALLLIAGCTRASGEKPATLELLVTADVWGEHGPCG